MRWLFLLLVFLPCDAAEWNSFEYFPKLDVFYHPVSTKSEEAQECFSRGLLAIYAFNYDEAIKCFDWSSQLDPQLAMGYWGMAL